MNFKRIVLSFALCLVVGLAILWFTGQRTVESVTRPIANDSPSPVDVGAGAFLGAGFGGLSMDALSTNAVPWHLTAAALVLEERRTDPSATIDQATLTRILKRFGFLSPAIIDNAPPLLPTPDSVLPLGMTHATIHPIGGASIRVANLGCASCHAGVTYSPKGQPQPGRVILGMPNSSLNLEAYTQAIFLALKGAVNSPQLLETVNQLFPNLTLSERLSLRWIVLPLAKQRLADLGAVDRPMPFPNGLPGSTNGVAALKVALGTPLLDGGRGDVGFVSIPDLSDRVWKTSFLADGAYGIGGKPSQSPMTRDRINQKHLSGLAAITTFFTVPSMGVHPDIARGGLKDGEAIMAFLNDYRAQPFPGSIDTENAERGRVIYHNSCASCHGTYNQDSSPAKLISYPNWIGDVGTDPLRGKSFDAALSGAITTSSYANTISVNVGRGYVAPPLSGIWASPPYLHNGSVQSLRALLTPAARLSRFKIGGHALDFDQMGINVDEKGEYPRGYVAFSQPAWLETSQKGQSNSGHTFGSGLTDAQKGALIDYLKGL